MRFMKMAVVHLTDIHFTEKTDFAPKMHPICQAIIAEVRNCGVAFLVLSGDIAFSGKETEYSNAQKFVSTIKQLIKASCPDLEIRIIMVPGNHDCDFSAETQVRKNLVSNINYQTIGSDSSVIDQVLSPQNKFWEFYEKHNPLPTDKLYFTIKQEVNNMPVVFHCINTAWMSKLNEEPGGLFFPVAKYDKNGENKDGIHFGVWHHPYNWFNPNTAENNKKEFERFTERIANVHFFGHEHEHSYYAAENKATGCKVNLFSGEVLNEDKKPNSSGFQTLTYDFSDGNASLKKFSWNGKHYESRPEVPVELTPRNGKLFEIKETFLADLDDIKIPFLIENRPQVKLREIFVFPDLDTRGMESTRFDNYMCSEKLLDPDLKFSVIDGESQVGKSTLLAVLYGRLYENGLTPVLLAGKELRSDNIEKYVLKAFQQQYKVNSSDISHFQQLDPASKVLLIDDYHETGFNPETTKRILDYTMKNFGKVVFAFGVTEMFKPSLRAEFHEVDFYRILPLGYKKRNELVERYLLLKENKLTFNEQVFMENVRFTFDNLQAILGDKLMPSYPVFILSILQALEYKPLKQNETSFAYCYQTLLHFSLYKAGVHNNDMDGYFNFLAELAYYFIVNDKEEITREEYAAFHVSYSRDYIAPSFESLTKNLKKAKIINEQEGVISFGYNYLLYFLSAKKIADIINTEQGKSIIKMLFDNMHNERHANVLVFITHHSKDVSFIEESLLNSMTVLDKAEPITLNRNDPFYNMIEEMVSEVKNDVLRTAVNPRKQRERILQSTDDAVMKRAVESEQENLQGEQEEINEITLPFQRAFRSIEIVGQIVRNRKGSLTIPKLEEMIAEVYTTGFRTIGHLNTQLELSKVEITEMINKEVKDKTDADLIEKKIIRFIQMICFEACISVFTKIMFSAGNKDLKSIYKNVALKLNTPAAKLVSFGINSYYNTIDPEDVRLLAEEFKGNVVALRLLRGRVQSYVYHKNPDFRIKQKFASYLNMTLPQPGKAQEKERMNDR